MSEASKALAEVRGWLCENLDASDAGHVCGMLSVVSRRVVQADELESENAKLRERIDAAHMSRLLTENENESLRELAGMMAKAIGVTADKCRGDCIGPYECTLDGGCPIQKLMRELGVEVDG